MISHSMRRRWFGSAAFERGGRRADRRRGRRSGPGLEHLERRAMLAADVWVNPAGGDWDVAANWSTGAVPAAADAAQLPLIHGAGYTVTHAQAKTDAAASLTAAAGTTLSVTAGTLSPGAVTADRIVVGGTGSLIPSGRSLVANSLTLEAGGATYFRESTYSGTTVPTFAVADFTNKGALNIKDVRDPNSYFYPEPVYLSYKIAGHFTNDGTVNLVQAERGQAVFTINGDVTNNGTLSLVGDTVLSTTGTLTNNPGGMIVGSGLIAAKLLDNRGLVEQTGQIDVNGAYTQEAGGTLRLDVGVEQPPHNPYVGPAFYDVPITFAVSGLATLGGTLAVKTVVGFTPLKAHTPIPLVTYGARVGTFSSLPAVNGFLPPTLSYGSTSLKVSITSPVTPGDFDGTGSTQLTVFRPATDQWLIRSTDYSDYQALRVVQFGDPAHGDVPVPGDYEGIGKNDLAVYRPSTGVWIIQLANGQTEQTGAGVNPAPHDIPAPGDYTGDGHTDTAVYRPSTGQWFVQLSNNQVETFQFGDPAHGDLPVPGNYEGNGKVDLAVFRPATDQWIIRLSNGQTQIRQFGDPSQGDIPVPGNYSIAGSNYSTILFNNTDLPDPTTNLAVYRPSTGQWIVRLSNGHTGIYQFGDASHKDFPAVGVRAL